MTNKLLAIAAQNAKLALAVIAGAALVAGGSTVAVTNVSDSTEHAPDASVTQTVAAPAAGEVEVVETASSASPTAGLTPSPRANNHGACVSAVARTKVAGETGREHGKRVSAAAKSCPKGGEDTAVETEATAAEKAAKKQAKADRKAAKKQAQSDRKSSRKTGRP